ncbi:MAG: sigma-54 dependent transcriptional regulator [Myxococcota bacterium]|nr:sigma-54 dependent transcriptional regulator [Myxococcota bacterium]
MNQEYIQDWRNRFAPNMIGQDPTLMKVFETIEKVCDTDCNILVTGESGTGKELVARAIHVSSPRSEKPFVALNCAAIPKELMESEIFGHVKGAFTGALERRDGRFAIADGGTLFLDEIGEMDLDLQGKFLRVIQEKEITPVGETKSRKVDVRLVAATNRDLNQQCKDGKFREDLFYRLNVIPINLPALKERIADVPMLCHYFIQRSNQRHRRMVDGMSDDAQEVLNAHAWPGNVREMENLIERLVILKKEGLIELSDLPPELSNSPADQLLSQNIFPADGVNLKETLEQIEVKLIKQALNRSGGNKAKAAELLQLKRTTLVERLKKLGLTT